MIIGVGTDIAQVKRFNSDKLAANMLGEQEMIEYQQCNNKPAYLAKRFAAKEACIKATGLLIPLSEIQILHKPSGAPYVISEYLYGFTIHISISDEKEYAVAFAVAERL
jgi:holo-[acyl-carrier protein] synthase